MGVQSMYTPFTCSLFTITYYLNSVRQFSEKRRVKSEKVKIPYALCFGF